MPTVTLTEAVILVVIGIICGVINVMAGGGSNIMLPVLMIMGYPAQIANATNRVGIFLQSVVGVRGFVKAGKMPVRDLPHILLPTLLGGIVGAFIASFAPAAWIKPLLLSTMLAMAAIMLFVPAVVMPKEGTVPLSVQQGGMKARLWLFLAGVYGGFVQAGVGFVLITAIAGSLRYDLIHSAALKLVCTLVFTGVALLLFAWQGQIDWYTGAILACGNMIGAHYGVHLAVNIHPRRLKQILFLMTLVAVIAAFLK